MPVMRFVGRSHVFHLQHVAAFGAALDGALAGRLLWDQVVSGCVCRGRNIQNGLDGRVVRASYRQPDGDVRVGGVAGAAGVLFVAEGADDDGVVESAWGRRGVSRGLSFVVEQVGRHVRSVMKGDARFTTFA